MDKIKAYVQNRAEGGDDEGGGSGGAGGGPGGEGEKLLWSVAGLALQFKVQWVYTPIQERPRGNLNLEHESRTLSDRLLLSGWAVCTRSFDLWAGHVGFLPL